MRRQSVAVPIRVVLESCDRFGVEYHKPVVVTVCTHINKGRDREFYLERKKKNNV